MTKRTRVLWSLLGGCLLVGGAASMFIWLGPLDHKGRALVRELAAVSDVMAFLFWMLVFAVYWTTRDDDAGGNDKQPR